MKKILLGLLTILLLSTLAGCQRNHGYTLKNQILLSSDELFEIFEDYRLTIFSYQKLQGFTSQDYFRDEGHEQFYQGFLRYEKVTTNLYTAVVTDDYEMEHSFYGIDGTVSRDLKTADVISYYDQNAFYAKTEGTGRYIENKATQSYNYQRRTESVEKSSMNGDASSVVASLYDVGVSELMAPHQELALTKQNLQDLFNQGKLIVYNPRGYEKIIHLNLRHFFVDSKIEYESYDFYLQVDKDGILSTSTIITVDHKVYENKDGKEKVTERLKSELIIEEEVAVPQRFTVKPEDFNKADLIAFLEETRVYNQMLKTAKENIAIYPK